MTPQAGTNSEKTLGSAANEHTKTPADEALALALNLANEERFVTWVVHLFHYVRTHREFRVFVRLMAVEDLDDRVGQKADFERNKEARTLELRLYKKYSQKRGLT